MQRNYPHSEQHSVENGENLSTTCFFPSHFLPLASLLYLHVHRWMSEIRRKFCIFGVSYLCCAVLCCEQWKISNAWCTYFVWIVEWMRKKKNESGMKRSIEQSRDVRTVSNKRKKSLNNFRVFVLLAKHWYRYPIWSSVWEFNIIVL